MKEITVRKWALPDSNGPPLYAVELGDKMLKAIEDHPRPPYNTIALGARIGDDGARDVLAHMREAAHKVDVAALLIEASRAESWDPTKILRECYLLRQRVTQLEQFVLDRLERAGSERPGHPPRLRLASGGEDLV